MSEREFRLIDGFEYAKRKLMEIAKGIFKWVVIIGVTIFILF